MEPTVASSESIVESSFPSTQSTWADPLRLLKFILRFVYPSTHSYSKIGDLTLLSDLLIPADKYDIDEMR